MALQLSYRRDCEIEFRSRFRTQGLKQRPDCADGSHKEYADVFIVGAGHGGSQCAIALRQHGFEGSILLIGPETEQPYERPQLSKSYLAREMEFERLHIRPADLWAERTLRLGIEVLKVDPASKQLVTDGSGMARSSGLRVEKRRAV